MNFFFRNLNLQINNQHKIFQNYYITNFHKLEINEKNFIIQKVIKLNNWNLDSRILIFSDTNFNNYIYNESIVEPTNLTF